jgi:hypothetical protein
MDPRRPLRAALVLGACSIALSATGCDTLHRLGHRNSASQPPEHWGKDPDEGTTELPAELKDQHKPTRLSGAWSSEAADIERSLGVGR